jgi:hypothetical protein
MGDGWELRFSAYGAPIWTRDLPTASQRRDTTVLLTFGGGDGPQRAGDNGVLWLKLSVGAASLARLRLSEPIGRWQKTMGQHLLVMSRCGRQQSSGAIARP